MNILLHTCCGPCSIYPVRILRGEGYGVTGYYHRNNIHPLTECMKREETLKTYAETIGLSLIIQKGYNLEGFLRNMAFRETERCLICYHERLTATAAMAKHGNFDAFSSTLLYSRYQKHEDLKAVGLSIADRIGVEFLYRDFRDGWQEGVDESRKREMYRQPYCGCIYSEKERYSKKLEKLDV
jgi:predicted adenine nucleotide alpha hydrolase (AANH) superfamily ATPase